MNTLETRPARLLQGTWRTFDCEDYVLIQDYRADYELLQKAIRRVKRRLRQLYGGLLIRGELFSHRRVSRTNYPGNHAADLSLIWAPFDFLERWQTDRAWRLELAEAGARGVRRSQRIRRRRLFTNTFTG